MPKSEEAFSEVYNNWDLEKLYADLATTGRKPLSPNAKTFLRGSLCNYTPAEIGKKLNYQSKDLSDTVRQTLSREVYPAIAILLNQKINWRKERLPRLLEQYQKGDRYSQTIEIPWGSVCRDMLERQHKQCLTSHPRGAANRRVQDVYVPLGLIERRAKPRVGQDFDPENWSIQEQEEKITPVSHEDFFSAIQQGKTPKSEGKRIAIIGEPGAGKTTLLQEISAKVDGVSIWIDLAGLKQGDTLEDWLLQKWLKQALSIIRSYAPEVVPNVIEPTTELVQAFTELFLNDKVWLLLDGADEMASELGQPLGWVAQQLRQAGWLPEARVMLTSRLNVWGIEGDRLYEFDTYRNLDFEPEQVAEFIDKWFGEQPETGQKLQKELERSSDRIQSLVRNPLRLTLVCLIWKGNGDKLPETKAGLYQRLVEAHYKWKDDKQEFVIDPDKRDELQKQLGELSKAALDSQESRFRLRKSFIAKFLGDPEKKHSLFWWATKLGWLNQVGSPDVDEVDADELVYAFFHPTFQEYFAALAIDDWGYFLPPEYVNQLDRSKTGEFERYRVFESQWNEVVLLWIGREDIIADQKESFLLFVEKFEDFCGGFYKIRAVFLALETFEEFDYYNAESIIQLLILWSLGLILKNESFANIPKFTRWEARSRILEATRNKNVNEKVIKVLIQILNETTTECMLTHSDCLQLMEDIGEISFITEGSFIDFLYLLHLYKLNLNDFNLIFLSLIISYTRNYLPRSQSNSLKSLESSDSKLMLDNDEKSWNEFGSLLDCIEHILDESQMVNVVSKWMCLTLSPMANEELDSKNLRNHEKNLLLLYYSSKYIAYPIFYHAWKDFQDKSMESF